MREYIDAAEIEALRVTQRFERPETQNDVKIWNSAIDAVLRLKCVGADMRGEKMNELKLNPGDNVWVIEYDYDGRVDSVTGYMFLAQLENYVVAAVSHYGCDYEEDMERFAQESADDGTPELRVFQAQACFATREQARERPFELGGDGKGGGRMSWDAHCANEIGYCLPACPRDGTPEGPFYDEDDLMEDVFPGVRG